EEVLVLQNTDSGLSISAVVRGPDGKLEAQIIDNEFFINPRNSFRIQRVGGSSLTVFNPQGEQILDVKFLNAHAIKILGKFFGLGGEQINIGEDEQVYTSHGATFATVSNCFAGDSFGIIELTPTGIQIR
ncbi:MAG: hypothetical protein WA765_21555, partial [Candidatus Acidiferrum sp.]